MQHSKSSDGNTDNRPRFVLTVGQRTDSYAQLEMAAKRLLCEVVQVSTVAEACKVANSNRFDVVALDGECLSASFKEITKLRRSRFLPEVLVLLDAPMPPLVEGAVKTGAWDVLGFSAAANRYESTLNHIFQYQSERDQGASKESISHPKIIGKSSAMQRCLEKAAVAARGNVNVLINGETGTGKELFAAAIHENSARRNKPFVVVDCTSLPENLVESLLFGHEKGAYTGALSTREGLIRQADGGTLFLDEIGELPLGIQTRFLRVLQEKSYRPVGGKTEKKSDFRVIAATNRDIERHVEKGLFREDLLFRLKSLIITTPPLRERLSDLEALTKYAVKKMCRQYRTPDKIFSSDFLDYLQLYHWPGNVRELNQALERAVVNAGTNTVIYTRDLPDDIRARVVAVQSNGWTASPGASILTDPRCFRMLSDPVLPTLHNFRKLAIEDAQAAYLSEVMRRCDGDVAKTLKITGLSRSRLYALLKHHGISLRNQ